MLCIIFLFSLFVFAYSELYLKDLPDVKTYEPDDIEFWDDDSIRTATKPPTMPLAYFTKASMSARNHIYNPGTSFLGDWMLCKDDTRIEDACGGYGAYVPWFMFENFYLQSVWDCKYLCVLCPQGKFGDGGESHVMRKNYIGTYNRRGSMYDYYNREGYGQEFDYESIGISSQMAGQRDYTYWYDQDSKEYTPTQFYYKKYLPSPSCKYCPAGWHSHAQKGYAWANQEAFTKCYECPSGQYSGVGAYKCKSCPNGKKVNKNEKATGCDKINCIPGSVIINGKCVICAAGKYSSSQGCKQCPRGKVTLAGEASCRDCTSGASNAERTACVTCNDREVAIGGACTNCGQGKVAVGNTCESCDGLCETCKSGEYLNPDTLLCYPCKSGTYMNEHSHKNTECKTCENSKNDIVRKDDIWGFTYYLTTRTSLETMSIPYYERDLKLIDAFEVDTGWTAPRFVRRESYPSRYCYGHGPKN